MSHKSNNYDNRLSCLIVWKQWVCHMYWTLCLEGTGAITHFTHSISLMVTSMFYVLMNRYCTVIMPFPQPNALCVKSQDVYVIRSIFPNKGKQTEGVEQRQEWKVQVKKDRRGENSKREIHKRKKRWSGVIQASAADILVVMPKCLKLEVSLYLSFFFRRDRLASSTPHNIRYYVPFWGLEWDSLSAYDHFRRFRSTQLIWECCSLALVWVHNLLTKAMWDLTFSVKRTLFYGGINPWRPDVFNAKSRVPPLVGLDCGRISKQKAPVSIYFQQAWSLIVFSEGVFSSLP